MWHGGVDQMILLARTATTTANMMAVVCFREQFPRWCDTGGNLL